nr:Buwchitin antimicrobial protein [uncultured bacterium]
MRLSHVCSQSSSKYPAGSCNLMTHDRATSSEHRSASRCDRVIRRFCRSDPASRYWRYPVRGMRHGRCHTDW